jgi:hypothetical protein
MFDETNRAERLAQFRAQQKGMKEDAVDESALQAYLGDKKYGRTGMNALRDAGREHASEKEKQSIRAKFSKKENFIGNEIKIYVAIFRTGSVLISGKCNENVVIIVYNFLKEVLIKEYNKIHVPLIFQPLSQPLEKEKEKKKRRKNITIAEGC